MSNLPSMSAEERLIAQQKAQAARDSKKVYAEENLKLNYVDEPYWANKASELNIRLPQQFDVGPKGMRKVAKKLDVDLKAFLETTGCANLNELVQLNPKWNSRSLAALIMEFHLEKQNAV